MLEEEGRGHIHLQCFTYTGSSTCHKQGVKTKIKKTILNAYRF